MPEAQRETLHAMAQQHPDIKVVDFVPESLKLMKNAECIISMVGYNTTTEILSFNKRALIVPRIVPRTEQWIRASRLAEKDIIDCLHPNDLTPQALSQWVHGAKAQRDARQSLQFNGLDQVVTEISQMIK